MWKQLKTPEFWKLHVLTDEFQFFENSTKDLISVRQSVNIPLLHQRFYDREYQFIEAKSIRADVVLLIASILTPAQVKVFTDLKEKPAFRGFTFGLYDETS